MRLGPGRPLVPARRHLHREARAGPHGTGIVSISISTRARFAMFDTDIGDHDVASNIPRLRVSLRLTGDALDPEFLTQQLGVAPTLSARRGEDLPDAQGGGQRDTGMWLYRLEVPPGTELGEVIDMLLAPFPEDVLLWEELTSAFTAEVFCGVFLLGSNQSTVIDAAVLQRLARLGLSLGLDFHAPMAVERDGDQP